MNEKNRITISVRPPCGRIFWWGQKPSPLGGRWRGTRRMRGECPAVATNQPVLLQYPQNSPSSVTYGDSFPPEGEAKIAVYPVGWRCRKTAGGVTPPRRKSLPPKGKNRNPAPLYTNFTYTLPVYAGKTHTVSFIIETGLRCGILPRPHTNNRTDV